MSRRVILLLVLALWAFGPRAFAEPYIAARARARCSTCHMNMTGGGERNAQGRMYGQGTLPTAALEPSDEFPLLTGEVAGFLTVGSDLRASNLTFKPSDRQTKRTNEFRTEEANLYLNARIWRDKLSVYVDERIAPGGAINREAFFRLRGLPAGGWLKAGRFLPPFGTRLYDDFAFIRTGTGYSFQTTDEGVEVGFEPGEYSLVASITNGAGGGTENDTSKQVSLFAARLMGSYRLGVSASNNVTAGTRTTIGGLFGSASWGDFVLLGEGDVRFDKDDGRSRSQWIGYVEAYWETTRGFTLRLSHEYLDPDRDIATNARTRSAFGFAWFPVSGIEIDARTIYLDGPSQTPGLNGVSFAAGVHLYF